MLKSLYEDAKNIKEKDPATQNIFEVILLYSGFHAIFFTEYLIFYIPKNLNF